MNPKIYSLNLAVIGIDTSNLEKFPMGSYFSSTTLIIFIGPWQGKRTIKKITFEINKLYKNL
jgi:hypothetical protein